METQSQKLKTICNICSIGCTLEVEINQRKILSIKGVEGLINPEGEYCSYPVKAVQNMNKLPRITEPLLRKDGNFQPIGWPDAIELMAGKIKRANPEVVAFFAGARLSNEEQYRIQKLGRGGAKTNNVGSFHYLEREKAYEKLTKANLPFGELELTTHIYLMDTDVAHTHPVLADFIVRQQQSRKCRVTTICEKDEMGGSFDRDNLKVASVYHFVKAVNYFILRNQLEDHQFLGPLIGNFEAYRTALLAESYDELIQMAGVSREEVAEFSTSFVQEKAAVLVFSENNSAARTCDELFNLACLSGKHGKTGSGLMLLKEKNNAHGLYDMGVMASFSPGTDNWHNPEVRRRFSQAWGMGELPDGEGITMESLEKGKYKMLFIFGEDPVGCAYEPEKFSGAIKNAEFVVVQDYMLTPTASLAHLILPASWPWENGGTYTNTQKVLQNTEKTGVELPQIPSWQQLNMLLSEFNASGFDEVDDVMFEIAGLFPLFCSHSKLNLRMKQTKTPAPLFKAGCDAVTALARQ
ncbi:MAG: molybdopterin-dependent oxidoreductase [Lentimicrobiaceae bacterium]|nr:molybdopterin-dependent oxidoreductase [Lentimicrobiaceae bacterium]